MTSWQIILGRLRGIWGQFLPALVVMAMARLVAVYIPHRSFGMHSPAHTEAAVFSLYYLLALLFAVPVVGLYYSLRLKTFFASLAATVVVGFFVPWLPCMGVGLIEALWTDTLSMNALLLRRGLGYNLVNILPAMVLIWLGVRFLFRLRRRLEKRQFVFATG
jgi:hypothetical protein